MKTWTKDLVSNGLRIAVLMIAWLFSWACLAALSVFFAIASLVWVIGRDLPSYDELASHRPATISRIYSPEGNLIDEFAEERRLFSSIEEIPPLVIHAVISAEDKSFFEHKGYDPFGIAKAAVQALRGGRLRGASTITQQVMKNFRLGGERTVERKVKEIILAVKLEKALDKNRILELYLNEIYLGQNSFGIASAAQTYFNKPLDELLVEEAAYLAAIPKAPSTYHPVRDKERSKERRNFVVREMVENGYISEIEGLIAQEADLKTVMGGEYESYRATLAHRDYFTDEIRRQLSDAFGKNEFFEGGLTIRATVDQELQSVAARALRSGLESYDRNRGEWIGTGLKLEIEGLANEETWRAKLETEQIARDIPGWFPAVVLSLVGGRAFIGVEGEPYSSTDSISEKSIQWIRRSTEHGRLPSRTRVATDFLEVGDIVLVSKSSDPAEWDVRQIPGIQGAFVAMDANSARVLAMQGGFSYKQSAFNRATQAYRQPGSAFKPIVYAAALDSGYTPASIVFDAPIALDTPEGIWQPRNASNKFYGPVPLRTGIEKSRNLMTVRLALDVGLETVAKYAEGVGLYDSMDQLIANSLGAQETTLQSLVVAYAMFANGGQKVAPTLVDRVQDRNGQSIYRHDQRYCLDCHERRIRAGAVPQILADRPQIIDEITAFQVSSMMTGVVERGTAASTVNPGVRVAGKTGTTNDAKDAWFIGFTSEIVAGCFMGYDLPTPLGQGASGASLCGPVFNEFIVEASKKYGSSEFTIPEGGVFVQIDRNTGEPVSDADAENSDSTVKEYFRLGEEPIAGQLRIVDGGIPMSSDFAVFDPDAQENIEEGDSNQDSGDSAIEEETQEGHEGRESFGSISAGGLY